MGDNAKALIGLGIVVVLAAVAYLVAGDNGIIAAGIVLIVGLIGIFVLTKRGGGSSTSDQYEYEDADEADAPAASTGGASTGSGGGLPTWSAEPLATWSPPEDGADEPEPAYASFDDDLDTSTFDELASFDDVDAVAEVDTYETITDDGTDVEYEEVVEAEVEPEPVKTSLFSAPAPIREDVHSDEEILEASHATELHVPDAGAGGGDNAELAKLLAKVQSRLAAYE